MRWIKKPLVTALIAMGGAQAAPPPLSVPAYSEDGAAVSPGFWRFLDGVNRSSALLGDLWGLRPALSRQGVSLAIQETSEVLGNTSGGVRKGFEYEGLTQVLLQMDTQRAWGHYGGLFNASVLNIHGNNLSASNLSTLQTASGIEADRGTRLWELWYSQNFLDENRLNLKIGQQSVDQEFMVSTNSQYFVNTMMGWPMLPSADLPAGGPAYPLSALGLRVSARPFDGLTLLAGVFNGSPVKNNNGSDPQWLNPHGTAFPWGQGLLTLVEAQWAYPSLGTLVSPDETQPLGWTYRLGAWYDSEKFADLRYGQSTLQHRGNYAGYAVADRLIWRDERDPNRTMALFARIMGTPLKDRNLIDFSLNAGWVFKSPFRYRADDALGVGFGYAHVSGSVTQFDQNNIVSGDSPAGPVRTREKFVELTYQYQWRPWIQFQPDLQYVMNPGGGIPDSANPAQSLKNEWVLGVRTNILF
jgi:porin